MVKGLIFYTRYKKKITKERWSIQLQTNICATKNDINKIVDGNIYTSNTHVKGCRLNQGDTILCSSDWQDKAKLWDNSDTSTLFGRE